MKRRLHYIYKITNNITNEYYIGKHSTTNLFDNYLGSGLRLKRSIKKYGKQNFTKIILQWADSLESLNELEAEYVNQNTLEDPLCLNLKLGGEGGWDYCIKRSPHNATKDKIWIFNAITGKNKLIEKNESIPIGYIKGKVKNKKTIRKHEKTNIVTNSIEWQKIDQLWKNKYENEIKKVNYKKKWLFCKSNISLRIMIPYNLTIPEGWKNGCPYKNESEKKKRIYIKRLNIKKSFTKKQIQHSLANLEKSKITRTGKKRIYNLKTNEIKFIDKELLNLYISNGWNSGYSKCQIRLKSRGKIWINKDSIKKLISKNELQEYINNGWKKGMV